MKNLKKIFSFLIFTLLICCGGLFGCVDKYKDLKISSNLEDSNITLIYGDAERDNFTFEINVSGAGGNISTNIKNPYQTNSGIVTVEMEHANGSTSTTVTIKAIASGSTDLIFVSEEGNQSLQVHVDSVIELEDIELNQNYTAYALIGQTIKIDASKCFNFVSGETTQREVSFHIKNQYTGVEVFENGTITVSETANNGQIVVVATSKSKNLSVEIPVDIIKGVDDFSLTYNRENYSFDLNKDDALQFYQNMNEESYKIIDIDISPKNYNYNLIFNLLDKDGNITSQTLSNGKFASDIFECEVLDNEHIAITTKSIGEEYLQLAVNIDGYDYCSPSKLFKLKSENIAKEIKVVNAEDSKVYDEYTIYDQYNGKEGKELRVLVAGENIVAGTNFVVRSSIDGQDLSKIKLMSARRDASGNLVPVKFFSQGAQDFDIIPNNSTLYIMANAKNIVEGDSISLDFVVYNSIGLLGSETLTTVTFNLRKGVSELKLDREYQDNVIMLPIKETYNGQTLTEQKQILVCIDANEYTESVYTNSSGDGYVLKNNMVSYQDAYVQDGKRIFKFDIYGVLEGVYTLTFYTPNGTVLDVKVRVFSKIDNITLTTKTIEQNSDIGELNYVVQETTNLKTLEGGSLAIRVGGVVELNINPYLSRYQKQINYQNIKYSFMDFDAENQTEENIEENYTNKSQFVRVDSSNNLTGLAEGDTHVLIEIRTWDDGEQDSNIKIYLLKFDLKVYVALQNIEFLQKNITIWTKSSLSDFVDESTGLSEKQQYGEFEFELKINPLKTSIDEENDINSYLVGNDSSSINVISKVYDKQNNTYRIKISVDDLPSGKDEGVAKLMITVHQYGRNLIADSSITIKRAEKIADIYDVAVVKNNIETPLVSYKDAPNSLKQYDFDYYMYIDSRDAINQNSILKFELTSKIEPETVLNNNLVYVDRKFVDESLSVQYDDVLSINNKEISVLNAGLVYVDICTCDSYNSNTKSFATKKTILIKCADGISKSTSFEVSSIADLQKINSNKANLDKNYIVTKNLNLASQGYFTPIGYVNGELNEFDGVFDGLLDDNFGEKSLATISGIRLSGEQQYSGLFAKLGSNAQITNLNVEMLQFKNTNNQEILYFGGICGENNGSISYITVSFMNSNFENIQNEFYFGGICGTNKNRIYNSYVKGEVNISGSDEINCFVGGFAGLNNGQINGNTKFFNNANIFDSYNSEINISATGNVYLGGIAGYSTNLIEKVSFDGVLNGQNNVGGIVGCIESNGNQDIVLNDAFVSGIVVGQDNVGGIVGKVTASDSKKATIKNISFVAYNNQNQVRIQGNNNVGGLIGFAENINLQNAYARSYINHSTLSNNDIQTNQDNAFVGGLVGYAKNVDIKRAYSIQKIGYGIAETANIGGLVGYADNLKAEIVFERNFGNLSKLVVAETSQNSTNVAKYFYSSNSGEYGIDIATTVDESLNNIQLAKNNVPSNTNIDYWKEWNITNSREDISSFDWYLTEGQYPFIIFENNSKNGLLTVEAPNAIKLTKLQSNYLYELVDENNQALENTFVLYRVKSNNIKFSSLFDVEIQPNDDFLNISKNISIYSSNNEILEIVGRTEKDFRFKLNSVGKVTLTIESKMNSDAKATITLFVLDPVSNFKIATKQNKNLIVGTNYELELSKNENFVNNNNFYIKLENSNNQFLINNNYEQTKYVKNNEKVFVSATKSGKYELNYSLFVRFDIDNSTYFASLLNITEDNFDISTSTIDFVFIYGIKDFVGDADVVETGLNDVATLTYTLTGDDLRIVDSQQSIYKLPKISYQFDNENWNINFVYANIYFGDIEPIKVLDLEDYDLDRLQNDELTKIEFVYELSVNKENAMAFFKQNAVDAISSDIKFTAKITETAETNEYSSRDVITNFVIKRQKIDNIVLDFYTNAELTKDQYNKDVYTVNEVPSNTIVAGQTGLLKILLSPKNAEVKSVKVSYRNESGRFNTLSLNQVLKSDDKYINRLPYAVATDNGSAIILYHNESNFVGEENQNIITNYDGYLYVNALIPSNVPSGEKYTITVDAIYTNNYHYVETIELTSRMKSTVEIGYNFNGQSLDSYAIIPVGMEKEFYIDWTEILEPNDINNLQTVVSPSLIHQLYASSNESYANIDFARDENGNIKFTQNGSIVRVYYTLNIDESLLEKESVDLIYLTAKITKAKNGIESSYQSKTFMIQPTKFVVTAVSIMDSSNENSSNIWVIPQTTPRQVDVSLTVDSKFDVTEEVDNLKNEIRKNYAYWFGRKTGKTQYETLVGYENNYANYNVVKSDDIITIEVKNINQREMIYCEVPFVYDGGQTKIAENESVLTVVATEIGQNSVGLNKFVYRKNSEILTKYVQYVRDDVTMDLTNDISSEHPIPISTEEEFKNMNIGTEENILHYSLTNDIELNNYNPMSLKNVSFDGNQYSITIKSFNFKQTDENGVVTYNSNFGLFDSIDENSIVKNLTVKYDIESNLISTAEYDMSTFNFGGICVENYGVIFNSKVENQNELTFVGNISIQTNIAGVCDMNYGYISYTESKLKFNSNCGYVAGFVATNSKKISNSKVVLNGNIKNTLTNAEMSLTAGFVSKNSGEIFGCYVSGENYNNQNLKISAMASVGGFVNINSGTISNSFTNVTIESSTYASGFVYENTGKIASCYASSVLQENSSAHTPFTGTLGSGNYLNSGIIDDCYYLGSYDSISNEPAKKIGLSKTNFQKFVFATDDYNGIWKWNNNNNPTLVDADINIFCRQEYVGVKVDGDISYHDWNFEQNNPSFGKIVDGKINPRTILDFEDWSNLIEEYRNDSFVILKDLTPERVDTPKTTNTDFGGILFGNNMKISNLYLRADSQNENKCFGLFKSISKTDDGSRPLIKDINISARQVMASASKAVGLLAGYIHNADIIDINIDGTNLEVVKGRNFVGVLAGIIKNSTVTMISVSGNVNAGYTDTTDELNNYVSTDLSSLIGSENIETRYSYSGVLAGGLLDSTTATYIQITGENKIIGFYSGSAVGLIDETSTLSLAKTEIVPNKDKTDPDQYVRAYAFAGGLVGENRGTIDRCYIEHNKVVQNSIDSEANNTYNQNNRNLNFFVGSPFFIGGLVGFNNGGTIKNSYSKLDVRANQYTTYASGGLVGLDVCGIIENNFATGSVTNRYIIGGLIGVESNKDFLLGTHLYKGNDIRNDDKLIFSVNAYITDEDELLLKNNLASNKWMLIADANGMNDAEYISNATTGFIVGLATQAYQGTVDEKTDVKINSLNNYFNSQVLKVNSNESITAETLNMNNVSILKNISSIMINYLSKYEDENRLADGLETLSIGARNVSIASVFKNADDNVDYEDDRIAKLDFNNVLISFENLLKGDELLKNNLKELFGINENNNIYSFDNSIYPTIVENINI